MRKINVRTPIKRLTQSLLVILAFAACEGTKQAERVHEENEGPTEVEKETGTTTQPKRLKLDQLKASLTTVYLKDDLKFLEENNRNFKYEAVDLNGNGDPEYFVLLQSMFYCGSGGCTLLLINDQMQLVTHFTVMNPPIFVEPIKKNGWPVLLIKSEGEWKELAFENGTYPENPSTLPKAPYDAPSGHAQILFDGEATTDTF